MRSVALMLFLGLAVMTAVAQTPAGQKPQFEVATIKSADPGQRGSSIINQPGGRLVVTRVPFRILMTFAYRVRDFQIVGGPGWIGTDMWDIEARAEPGTVPPPTGPPDPTKPDPVALRLQSLLEDRFVLKTHRETKETPIYELTVAKSGLKMKLNEDQTFKLPEPGAPPPQPGGPMPRGGMRMGRGMLQATAVPVSNFVMALSYNWVERL